MNDAYLYPRSAREARERGELELWRASHRANIACKQAIEAAIRRDFDGMYLKPDCARSVIAEYGFRRVNFVLANTLKEKDYDGRFSPDNKAWAKSVFLPPDQGHSPSFCVESHPAVLDGFINEARQAYQALGLFGPEHCAGDRQELDYTGKVLVISPDTLKESCWAQQNQLWYAHDGFGCSPHAIGRSIRCICLGDGEMTRWNRGDFIGVLEDKYLPDWASEKLSELRGQGQSRPVPQMGMNM